METTDSTDTKDLPAIAANMLNAWHAPSNPYTWTAEDYRGLKHYGGHRRAMGVGRPDHRPALVQPRAMGHRRG